MFFSFKSEADSDASNSRQARGFCKDSYGVFCMLYNAVAGKQDKAADRIGMYQNYTAFRDFLATIFEFLCSKISIFAYIKSAKSLFL